MKRLKKPLIIVSVASIFIVVLYFLLPKEKIVVPDNKQNATSTEQVDNEEKGDMQATQLVNEKLDECIATEKQTVISKGTEYEKGSVLVGFDQGIFLEDAASIIVDSGFTYTDSQEQRDNFANGLFLTAGVKVGDEFKAICVLKGNLSVRYVGINPSFKLRE